MQLSAGWMPAGRQKKNAVFAVIVGLALTALGSVAVSGPTANAGAIRLSTAEYVGFGLLAGGIVVVFVGVIAWLHAAMTASRMIEDTHPVNHWRGPTGSGRWR
jgi:protein-S-isoprenylcysteine O-methyltransferase Ste14